MDRIDYIIKCMRNATPVECFLEFPVTILITVPMPANLIDIVQLLHNFFTKPQEGNAFRCNARKYFLSPRLTADTSNAAYLRSYLPAGITHPGSTNITTCK